MRFLCDSDRQFVYVVFLLAKNPRKELISLDSTTIQRRKKRKEKKRKEKKRKEKKRKEKKRKEKKRKERKNIFSFSTLTFNKLSTNPEIGSIAYPFAHPSNTVFSHKTSSVSTLHLSTITTSSSSSPFPSSLLGSKKGVNIAGVWVEGRGERSAWRGEREGGRGEEGRSMGEEGGEWDLMRVTERKEEEEGVHTEGG